MSLSQLEWKLQTYGPSVTLLREIWRYRDSCDPAESSWAERLLQEANDRMAEKIATLERECGRAQGEFQLANSWRPLEQSDPRQQVVAAAASACLLEDLNTRAAHLALKVEKNLSCEAYLAFDTILTAYTTRVHLQRLAQSLERRESRTERIVDLVTVILEAEDSAAADLFGDQN